MAPFDEGGTAGAPGRFGSVLTAMVTPFDESGALDLDAVAVVARWLADNGSDGLVVGGTTGEAPVLTDEEKRDLWRAAVEAVTVPVVAGAGSSDTAHTVELVRAAEESGAAGVLVVTPYYNRPSQAGLEAHFRATAAATTLPVLIYDIPVRTGRKVANDTLLRLARQVPNIVGVKDAAGDVPGSARLVAEAPAGFELLSGDDTLTLPLLAVGARGVVGVAAHWTGELHRQLFAAFANGDVAEARRVNALLLDSFSFETSEAAPNPLPAKAMMRVLGLPVGQCRLPMGPAPAGLEEQARKVLDGLGEAAPTPYG